MTETKSFTTSEFAQWAADQIAELRDQQVAIDSALRLFMATTFAEGGASKEGYQEAVDLAVAKLSEPGAAADWSDERLDKFAAYLNSFAEMAEAEEPPSLTIIDGGRED
jgi:hypothetical protein